MRLLPVLILFSTTAAFSAPIDWHGKFGVDTVSIDTYRRSNVGTTTSANGSQEIVSSSGDSDKASYQSYILQLNPNIIVNDSVTLKGEITSNYGRGGFLGDASTKQFSGNTAAHALYLQNTTTGEELRFNQFYMELYSDTATYRIGRMTKNWGLGAVYNSGDKPWDRIANIHDGLEANLKIGHFYLTPYYTKLSNGATQVSNDDAKDYGISALYDNPDKEVSMGVLYSRRKSRQYTNYQQSAAGGTTVNSQITDIKVWDIFIKKKWKNLTFGIEAPMVSGDMGFVYNTTQRTQYNTNAYIGEISYKVNKNWDFDFHVGRVKGDQGTIGKFQGMYLNPNYQIAYLMFRYNLTNMNNSTDSIWDSYITNAQYLKYTARFTGDTWNFTGAFIYATALETAQTGSYAYDHEKNRRFLAAATQQDDYGMELDLSVDYIWNTNVTIGGIFAYHFTGDYYQFTNAATTQKVENTFMTGFNVLVNF